MNRTPLSLPALLLVLALTIAACVPITAEPPAPQAEVPTAEQPAEAEDTSQPATSAPQTLRLATTTSTADSGLLDAILPDFEEANSADVDVIAVGTGQALEIGGNGDADVVLVHSRKAEDQFVADGHARERFDVMYNDFVLVGPAGDPAGIAGITTAKEAFQAIMEAEAPFISRGDNSGTHNKEMAIWASTGVTPTQEMQWYNSIGQGMGDTLLMANEQQAYTVADRGTYLSMMNNLPELAILVGGDNLAQNQDEILLNPYGVMAVNPDQHPGVQFELSMAFIEWLLSPDTQVTIGEYGTEEFGQPLFYPDSEQYRAAQQ